VKRLANHESYKGLFIFMEALFFFRTITNFMNPEKTLILKIPAFAQEVPALVLEYATSAIF
jgi:hypothetical protein